MFPDQQQARILIVEDNYLIADEVGGLVRSFGHEVVGATSSVAGGLKIVEQQPIDGAVLDINLGTHTSFPLCAALQDRGVPFAFLSGYSARSVVPPEFHAKPHLAKPVDRRELKRVIEALLAPGPDLPKLGNRVLDGLPRPQRRTVEGHLEEVVLKTGDLLDPAGQVVSHVYFPSNALISIFAGKSRGQRIEAASIGSDGLTAPSFALGDVTALGDTIVQMGGRAWRIPAKTLRQLTESDPRLRRYLFGRVGLALRDIMATSSFTGRYTIIERLARWLVQTTHRVGSPRLVITHAALAEILAVRRPSISLGLQTIEGFGLIRSRPRAILVRDLEGLTNLARLNGLSTALEGGAE